MCETDRWATYDRWSGFGLQVTGLGQHIGVFGFHLYSSE